MFLTINKIMGWQMVSLYIGLWSLAIIALIDTIGNFGWFSIIGEII